jgi:hypothetical protein
MYLLKGSMGRSLDRDVASTPYGVNTMMKMMVMMMMMMVMVISSGYGNANSSRMYILSLALQPHYYID